MTTNGLNHWIKKADKIQKEIREAELVKEWAEKQLNKLNENN